MFNLRHPHWLWLRKKKGALESSAAQLEQTSFSHGTGAFRPHNHMIQHADIHQGQGFFEPLGDLRVCRAGFRQARGMVVSEYQGCRIESKGSPDNHPGVDAGTVHSAPE